QLVLRLRAEPLERAELVLGEDATEVVDRRHAQLGPQALDRLGPNPLDAEQRHDGRRVLLAERLELRHLPALEELADLARGALPDAVDLLEILRRELRQVRR